MQECLFVVLNSAKNGTMIYRMVGFDEVYFINEREELAALFTEDGRLVKQWNNIYEFREDFSRDCFESDEDMMRAEYQLNISKRTLNKPYAKLASAEAVGENLTKELCMRAMNPIFYN